MAHHYDIIFILYKANVRNTQQEQKYQPCCDVIYTSIYFIQVQRHPDNFLKKALMRLTRLFFCFVNLASFPLEVNSTNNTLYFPNWFFHIRQFLTNDA